MPRSRDPNYDTLMEYAMDHEEDRAVMKRAEAKLAAERHKCQCGTMAVIKTLYDRDGVAYHCSEQCKQWWLRVAKVLTIDKVERNNEGWGR